MKERSLNYFWAIKESYNFSRFTKKNIIITICTSIVYFIWFHQIVGFRPEHLTLYVLLLALFYINAITRSFLKAMLPFIVFWILYDSLRIIPNYMVNDVHIQQPYEIEKQLFGINDDGKLLTLNEYFSKYHTSFLDFLSGFFYLNWIPIPLLFCLYAFFKDKVLIYSFTYCFLFVNLIGFLIYYLYPAAPPWYVAQYGFTEHFDIMGNTGNLKHFDALVGLSVFKGIYEKNANVFAAMPSLHSAYPVIVLYFATQNRSNYFKIPFVIFCLGIWGGAVYSNHHYVIDVLAGIICAVVGITIFNLYLKKWVIQYILPL
jgi:inositol phosphorylceramide synthase catalytic subunit